MNTKKIITTVLAVFVLCAVLCGTVSAFDVMKSPDIKPSGSLMPNENVTGYLQLKFPSGDVSDAALVYFNTDLTNATWTVSIGTGGGAPPVLTRTLQPGDYNFISGYDLTYGKSDIIMDITITGTVLADSGGKNIQVMKIMATEHAKTNVGEVVSTAQKVYNSTYLSSDIQKVQKEIDDTNNRIATYITYGWDVSKAQSKLEQARSKLNEARNITDTRSAYMALETAENLLLEAERELALASLSMTLSYTTYTQTIIDKLYAKGWNSEAMLLDTKNSNLKNTYNQQYATYLAGNLPDAAALDKQAADSYALYQDALVYEEAADNPLGGLLNYLPFILIGLGAAAIIAVVVVVIIKKRKNSWDELG